MASSDCVNNNGNEDMKKFASAIRSSSPFFIFICFGFSQINPPTNSPQSCFQLVGRFSRDE